MNNRHQERKKEREREMSRSNEGAFFTLSFTVGSCMAADHTPTTHTQTLEETVKSNINVSRKRFEIPWLPLPYYSIRISKIVITFWLDGVLFPH